MLRCRLQTASASYHLYIDIGNSWNSFRLSRLSSYLAGLYTAHKIAPCDLSDEVVWQPHERYDHSTLSLLL